MKKTLKSTKGITLVALVITIIILLILATISIQSLTNTGLFKNAQKAREETNKATENQEKRLNEYEDEINKYFGEEKKIEGKIADRVADGTIKVGDYVTYTPDTVINTDTKYTTLISNLGTYSGSDKNTTSTLTQESLKWRVLDVQNGQVRLISEVPTTSKITLYGDNGYNNAVKLIDDTCSTLYNNSKLASKVQNLKIEDITKYMTTQPTEDTTPYSPTDKYYPEILLKENGQTVNGTAVTELDLSEQTEFINQTTKSQVSSWTLKNTYWSQTMNNTDSFTDSKYYELFINNGSNYSAYWTSSRCVDADSYCADFGVRRVIYGYFYAYDLCNSRGRVYSGGFAFRPCITLNSNVQVTSGSGSAGAPFNIQ